MFHKFYGDKVAQEVIAKVRSKLNRLYDYYSFVPSPNVQVPIGSEGTQVDPYTMVDSQYEHFLEAKQFERCRLCSNEIEKYMAENCEGRKVVNFDILE